MIYISRRTDVPLKKAVTIKAFAILLSLVVCALVLFVMTHLNPLDIYIAMFKGRSIQCIISLTRVIG